MSYPLPLPALDQHAAFVGKVGAGKTYAAKGAVERLLDAKRRVCIIDPTGAWWGLRSSSDGKKPGYPVVVFGGEHADVPISQHSGPALAELIAKGNLPCVIDLSEMLIGERHRFMESFAEALHRLNRAPLHLVIDEADEFAPQNPLPETKRMLHQVDRIVRRGRIRGFRVVMISQRPAVLHKNVLTQANTLIAMRLTAPQDRRAIEEWVKGQGDMEKGREVLASLASLQRGEGWIWAPERDILKRAQFPRISTFDSSRAPEEGQQAEPVTTLAKVDLGAIEKSLADAVKEAEANDPKKLRARIAELERNAKKAPAPVAPVIDQQAIDAAVREAKLEGHREAVAMFGEPLLALRSQLTATGINLDDLIGKTAHWEKHVKPAIARPLPQTRHIATHDRQTKIAAPKHMNGAGEPMGKAERAMLTVLAQYPEGRDRPQLALLAGYSPTSGHIDNTVGSMRSKGWATPGWPLRITKDGLQALGSWEPLPTGEGLRRYWLDRLDKAGAAFMRVLIERYPEGATRAELATGAGYEPTSGHVDNTLGRLRTFELATRGWPVRASDILFED